MKAPTLQDSDVPSSSSTSIVLYAKIAHVPTASCSIICSDCNQKVLGKFSFPDKCLWLCFCSCDLSIKRKAKFCNYAESSKTLLSRVSQNPSRSSVHIIHSTTLSFLYVLNESAETSVSNQSQQKFVQPLLCPSSLTKKQNRQILIVILDVDING